MKVTTPLTPVQEALLRAALLPDDDARRAWTDAVERFGARALEQGSFSLMPLLYVRRETLGIARPAIGKLRGTYRRTWYRNQVLLRRLYGTLDVLSMGGVEPVVLGAAGVMPEYQDPNTRPIPHLELLVRPTAVANALGLLAGDGWAMSEKTHLLDYAQPVTLRDQSGNICFLSTTPTPGFPAVEADIDGFYERSSGAPIRRLGTTDRLWQSCSGHVRSNAMQAVADAWFTLRSREDISWDRFVQLTIRSRTVLAVRAALSVVSRLDIDVVPDAVLRRLEDERPTRREVVAETVASWSGRFAGDFPQTVANYIRVSERGSFARYLAASWGIHDRTALPRVAAAKIVDTFVS